MILRLEKGELVEVQYRPQVVEGGAAVPAEVVAATAEPVATAAAV